MTKLSSQGMICRKIVLLGGSLLCFLWLSCPPGAVAADFVPWDFTARETKEQRPDLSLPALLLKEGVVLFSAYISPVDGDRCALYPTCAAYSREAFERHGFFLGLLLTVDRLIHEGNEMDLAPLVKIHDRLRYYDPVHNNVFWRP